MYLFNDTIKGESIDAFRIKTTFNGVLFEERLNHDSGYYQTLTVSGRDLVNQKHLTSDVPGRHGHYFLSQTLEVREISVKAKISGKTDIAMRQQYESLNRLLVTHQPAWLAFSDDPNRFFLAQFKEKDVPEEIANEAVIELTFVCYSPFKFSEEKTQTVNAFYYDGHFESKPIVTLTLANGGSELRLLHVESQRYIRLTGLYTAGNVIAIDMSTGAITQNGRNILADLDMVNSRYFSLLTGKNTLQVNMDASVTTVYREVYL